jgi:hypothetical protein
VSEIITIEPYPGRDCCDFCTAEPVHRLYACRNFIWLRHAMFAHESIGAKAVRKVEFELLQFRTPPQPGPLHP